MDTHDDPDEEEAVLRASGDVIAAGVLSFLTFCESLQCERVCKGWARVNRATRRRVDLTNTQFRRMAATVTSHDVIRDKLAARPVDELWVGDFCEADGCAPEVDPRQWNAREFASPDDVSVCMSLWQVAPSRVFVSYPFLSLALFAGHSTRIVAPAYLLGDVADVVAQNGRMRCVFAGQLTAHDGQRWFILRTETRPRRGRRSLPEMLPFGIVREARRARYAMISAR
jgi:hypothetical protein